MRTNLELYLLTLIRDGFATPYELKSRANLSVGSTIPALARLEKEGLIKKSELQARRSRRYSLTSKGEKCLRNGWRDHLDAEPADLDSILRITYLVWTRSSKKHAADYLRRAGMRLAHAPERWDEPNRFGKNTYKAVNDSIRSLRARIEAHQKASLADELIRISTELGKASTRPGADRKREIKKR